MLWQHGKAYPQDLRERVFAHAEAGMPVGGIARILLVSSSYVSKVLSRRRETGERSARAQRCHVPPRLAGLASAIKDRVAAKPDSTLGELCAWLAREHEVSASIALMGKTLIKLGLTVKKRPCMPPNRTAPMSPRGVRTGRNSRAGWTSAS